MHLKTVPFNRTSLHYRYSMHEDAEAGTSVGSVTAQIGAGTGHQNIVYDIVSDHTQFTINSQNVSHTSSASPCHPLRPKVQKMGKFRL